MRVLGFTDEITTCDCCGKTNLRGSFGVETDAGETLYYGSVCVNRVYGKTKGEALKGAAKRIASAQAGSWDSALDRLGRGQFGNDIMGLQANGKPIWNNSTALLRSVTAIARYNGKSFDIIRERS